MTKWLPKDSDPSLPLPPNHQIGSAGIVFSPDGKVLVVQEKSGPSPMFFTAKFAPHSASGRVKTAEKKKEERRPFRVWLFS